MSEELLKVFNQFESVFDRGISNKYINITIKVLLGLYAAMAAPKLSRSVAKLMDNILVRIGFAIVIVYMATKDITISLLVAIIFIITLQTANKYKIYDTSLSVSEPGASSWLPSAKSKINDENNIVQSDTVYNLVEQVPDVNVHGLSKDEIQTMRNSEPSKNLEQFVEQIEGSNNTTHSELIHEENNDTNIPTLVETQFTSDQNLYEAQSGKVPGTYASGGCHITNKNQHCIQGIESNAPNGFNDTRPVSNF